MEMWQLRDEVQLAVNPARGSLHSWGPEVTPLKDGAQRRDSGGAQIQDGTAELAPSSRARRSIEVRFTRTRMVMKKSVRWRDCGGTEERHKSLKCSC